MTDTPHALISIPDAEQLIATWPPKASNEHGQGRRDCVPPAAFRPAGCPYAVDRNAWTFLTRRSTRPRHRRALTR